MTEKKRGRPKGEPLIQVLSMKGTPRWRKWLEEFANRLGLTSSKLIDEALAEKAERHEHEPPPDRTGDKNA